MLFDLDQTLVEVVGAWRAGFIEAWTAVAAQAPALRGDPGAIHDREYRAAVARLLEDGDGDWHADTARRAIAAVFAGRGVDPGPLLDATVEAYHDAWLRRTRLFPDALPVLDALGGRLPLGLITDGAAREQRAKIERHGLAERFRVILVSREVGARKPHPPMFEQALRTLSLPAGSAVYVGDNPHRDVAGALACGLGAVWLNRDDAPYPADAPAPHHAIGDLRELPGLLGLS